jgi:predicted small secreted protein
MPVWAAALIVTVIYAAIAVAAAMSGRNALQGIGKDLPRDTAQTVSDDVATVRASVERGREVNQRR